MSFKIDEQIANFGGKLLKLSHNAKTLQCRMNVNLFLPPIAEKSASSSIPVVIFLSGLSCTPQNCTEKGFLQPWAAKHNLAVIYPDTSPRGKDISDDEEYDLGQGAGFYLTATRKPWNPNYKMDEYIIKELIPELTGQFSVLDSKKLSITGHSMGGHGALSLFLKNPSMFKSVSAFAPILNPSQVPWGQKAFKNYLGDDQSTWTEYDTCHLIEKYQGPAPEILIDIGTSDNFLYQLSPEEFQKAVEKSPFKGKVNLRMQEGYNHSYFFISSFAQDHIEHAAKYLQE